MPQSVGRYTILDRIGAGALGELYRARDTRFGRTVALRLVAPAVSGDAALRLRLFDCARAAEAISHPGIAALFEHGEEAGGLYLASEFVPGRTLALEIAGVPLNPRRAAAIAAQIADALAEAHAAGIVHGRLTAAAVIVSPRGTAKLLDVGLTGWREPIATDERADVAALGRVLGEMITGRPSAGGAPVLPLRPPAFDAVVRRALAAETSAEWPAPAVLASELRTLAQP